ncbi:hypothetical protein [Sulfurihydrogenibium sp.]|uniref:hypothetical protein n=1 Tax=Sulfurihydrogenibium sp. TaxID=2053621 RepID=UPI002632EE5C|nr:hypothetical protein [Sulfurihydrogenibium sp.]
MQDPQYIEVRLLEKVLSDMFDSSKVFVCLYDTNKAQTIKKYSDKIIITDCQNAQIFLTDKHIPENSKPVFALNDEILKTLKNAIGGLYWKKGRPQLIFLEDRLDKFNIKLPPEYKGFMIQSKNLTFVLVQYIVSIHT